MSMRNDCIVWIHGLGQEQAGYSKPWSNALNNYFLSTGHHPHYTEVLWADIFTQRRMLDPVEQLLRTVIMRLLPAGFLDLLPDPEIFTEEVVLYLTRPDIRAAVNDRLKDALRTLSGCDSVSIIGHSFGTVIAYETLQELTLERPTFRVNNLFTLGSPLKYLRPFLPNNPGPKPADLATWANVFAFGDIVSSMLSPDFQVDQEHLVPNFGGGNPHTSYFLPGNKLVLECIITYNITHV